jgi:UDP-N-acetylglucosamine 4,6-dehydratase/5-epimerase
MDSFKTLVAGGSGFLGQALIERLLAMGRTNITSMSRNEGEAVALKQRFPQVSIFIGDIANPWDVKRAMRGAEEVFLLSAMKHVGLAEAQVQACINTNIVGTMNIINESLITKPKVLMFISSDKAAQSTGVYGCSKKIGERLMAEAEKVNPDTKYRVVRYGNVLFSTGSVLCKWKDKMQAGEEVIVTDVNATRFFWPISQAVDLIFESIDNAKDAAPFFTAMKAMAIGDLLDAMMEKYGRVPVKTIGLQPGENMHEIIAEGIPDSFHSPRYTKEEILQII